MNKHKVLVLLEAHEEIAEEGLKKLEKNNIELVVRKNNTSLFEMKNLEEFEGVLVRGSIINREMIERMSNLKIIARSGVGVDNIDVQAATDNGVYVCNVPDANFISVAEHVIGMIISLSHQIVKANNALKDGNFNVRHLYMGIELKGKTIGIIGFGKIGQLVAKKCVEGLGMKVLVYDPYVSKVESNEDIRLVSDIDIIFEKSDFISLHLPYIPKLHHFINEDKLKKMKRSAYLINCARGGLVDEVALAKAIKNKEIAGAGIDVFEKEPPAKDNCLLSLENVIVTPHTAASTKESLTRMATGAAEEIIRVLNGERPKNNINIKINERVV